MLPAVITPAPPLPIQLYHWRSADVSQALDVVGALPPGDPLAGRADTRTAVLSGHSFGSHTTWSSAGATFDLDVPVNLAVTPDGQTLLVWDEKKGIAALEVGTWRTRWACRSRPSSEC